MHYALGLWYKPKSRAPTQQDMTVSCFSYPYLPSIQIRSSKVRYWSGHNRTLLQKRSDTSNIEQILNVLRYEIDLHHGDEYLNCLFFRASTWNVSYIHNAGGNIYNHRLLCIQCHHARSSVLFKPAPIQQQNKYGEQSSTDRIQVEWRYTVPNELRVILATFTTLVTNSSRLSLPCSSILLGRLYKFILPANAGKRGSKSRPIPTSENSRKANEK